MRGKWTTNFNCWRSEILTYSLLISPDLCCMIETGVDVVSRPDPDEYVDRELLYEYELGMYHEHRRAKGKFLCVIKQSMDQIMNARLENHLEYENYYLDNRA